MKKLKKIIVFIAAMAVLSSCVYNDIPADSYTGDPIEKTFDVSEFNGVDVGSALDVVIIPSSEFKVTVEGIDRDVNDLIVRVVNKTLKIAYRKGTWLGRIGRDKMDVLIEMPSIKSLDASSSSKVNIEDFPKQELLKFDLSGASKLEVNVAFESIKGDLSGASNVNFQENCDFIDLDISGASTFYGFPANAKEAYLNLSGASKAEISVSDKLVVDASGASTVRYRGKPEVNKNLSGASKVIED